MWIRSQDKMLLINCDNFSIEGYPKSFDIETIEAATGNRTTLGAYSSKEKALKVLDMIQEVKVIEHYNNIESVVFQMPQDSEVK